MWANIPDPHILNQNPAYTVHLKVHKQTYIYSKNIYCAFKTLLSVSVSLTNAYTHSAENRVYMQSFSYLKLKKSHLWASDRHQDQTDFSAKYYKILEDILHLILLNTYNHDSGIKLFQIAQDLLLFIY